MILKALNIPQFGYATVTEDEQNPGHFLWWSVAKQKFIKFSDEENLVVKKEWEEYDQPSRKGQRNT